MFQRKPRRFRRRPNGRNQMLRGGANVQVRQRSNSFSNGQTRNNFGTSLSAEKLFERYTSLAKEAVSSGDISLSENYLQHADHFMRVIEGRNENRNQDKVNDVDKPIEDNKKLSVNDAINQDNKVKN